MRRPVLAAATLLAAALAAAGGLWVLQARQPAGVTAQALELGRRLYAEHCASCHGANLEGQPDWKTRLPSGRLPAPPHDASGHTWHHSDDVLFRITRDGPAAIVGGGYESDMPGFREVLSDQDIRAVIEFIKSTWPERERQYQAEISRREQKSRGSASEAEQR